MVSPILSENPENTHQAVLFYLKRGGEMTVADLCEVLNVTSMAVRRHLTGLQKDGLVDCRLVKQNRGRPTYKYRLTKKAEGLFPSAANDLALELLDAVFEAKGHPGVMEILTLRQDALLRKLLPELEPLSFEERVEAVAKIFYSNGYMTQWQKLPDGNFFIYQQHCAVHDLATKHRQICVMESNLLEKLVGAPVTREKYIMKNEPVCGYRINSRGGEKVLLSSERSKSKLSGETSA